MRIAYKVLPLAKPSPIYPGRTYTWTPILDVNLMYNHTRSARVEAVVDSGSPWCLFHSEIGLHIGVDIAKGIEHRLGGVIGGAGAKMYFHKVKLCLPGTMIDIMAGFSDTLSVAAILGRTGFFDNYTITFDPCSTPPGFEMQRVGRV